MKKKFLIALLTVCSCLFILFAGACKQEDEQSSSSTPVVETPVKTVYFDEETYTVDRFSILKLNANYQGEQALVWKSTDESVAVVKDGEVLASKVGTAEIIVKAEGEEAKCKVVVRETTAYPTLRLSQAEMEIAKGKTKTIYASLVDNANKEISSKFVAYSYASNDENIVTIDETGVVTGLALGQTTVTVSAVCAGETIIENISILVRENVNLSFDKSKLSLYANSLNGTVKQSERLQTFVYQDDTLLQNPTLIYTVADDSVAIVSATGVVTGVSRGNTTVTVSYTTDSVNEFTASIKVEVICPVVQTGRTLDLEVYALQNSVVDFTEYSDYFADTVSEVEVYDDLGTRVLATVDDGVVTLDNQSLAYGERKLSFVLNTEVVLECQAKIVTKYISMASELACFASKYGKRDASTGSYDGWFILTDNIDMTGVPVEYSFGSGGVWANDAEHGFKGVFDGQGYAIYNMSDNIFGKVSADGVVKNTAFYSKQAVAFALVSGVFAGRLENAYICADLSQVTKDYYTGVSFRTVGEPVFENVVVEITNKRESVQSTVIHDASKGAPTCINVYLISPSAKDPTTETNNILPIHYATADANKDFSNLDKSSGYWTNRNGVFRFSACAYFEIARLATPDSKSFTIGDNNTLTWTAVPNASGYTVLINGMKEEVQANSVTGVTHGMIIEVKANGDGVSFRDSAYSQRFFYLKTQGNYLADFSAEAYMQMVVNPTESEHIIPKSVTAEYVQNVTDKKGAIAEKALKITSVTNNITVGFGDFDIKLPKATTQTTVTLRFMISSDSTEGLAFRMMNASRANGAIELTNYEKDVWHTVAYTYTADMDCIKIRICDIKGATGIMYFDCVMDGDCREELANELLQTLMNELKAGLTGNYLADFSTEKYKQLVANPTDSEYIIPVSVSAEYVQNVTDKKGEVAENALKVTTHTNNITVGFGDFDIKLPKATTQAMVTIRFMISSDSTEGLAFRTMNASRANGAKELTNYEKDVWHILAYTYTADMDCIKIRVCDIKGATGVMYFDFVMDGDCVGEWQNQQLAKVMTTLNASLTGNKLADFSSKLYEKTVMQKPGDNYFVPQSINANYVTNVADGSITTDALKVTIVTNTFSNGTTSGFADFIIKLPKAVTAGSRVKLRFMIDGSSTQGLTMRAMHAGWNAGAVEFTSMQKGVWHEVTYAYEYNSDVENKDYLAFRMCDLANATGILYFDWVIEEKA